jgi:hypothetical protein
MFQYPEEALFRKVRTIDPTTLNAGIPSYEEDEKKRLAFAKP